MNKEEIIRHLEAERDRITEAIDLLQQRIRAHTPQRSTGRTLSAEARRRISEAQKKRWAARKKNDKKPG